MVSRWSLGLFISLLAHVSVVAIGLLMGARGFSGPVDVEIAGVNLEEIKDLPLGGPQSGEGRSGASARMRSRAPQVPPADGTMAERPGKDQKTRHERPANLPAQAQTPRIRRRTSSNVPSPIDWRIWRTSSSSQCRLWTVSSRGAVGSPTCSRWRR